MNLNSSHLTSRSIHLISSLFCIRQNYGQRWWDGLGMSTCYKFSALRFSSSTYLSFKKLDKLPTNLSILASKVCTGFVRNGLCWSHQILHISTHVSLVYQAQHRGYVRRRMRRSRWASRRLCTPNRNSIIAIDSTCFLYFLSDPLLCFLTFASECGSFQEKALYCIV